MKTALRIFIMISLIVPLTTSFAQDDSMPPYKDPTLPIEERITDLLGRMSLEEKIGQMTLIEKGSITPQAVTELYLGGVLSGGGGSPTGNNTPVGWAEMVDGYQAAALATPLAIPMIYGVDAVHGHGNLAGATIFPHNIGLGATRNPDLVEQICHLTALEMIATGIYWNYSPVVAVVQDIRWGRTYEGFSENTDLVTELSLACIRGLQGEDLAAPDTVLATPKHYIGDGGTTWGSSTTGDYQLDQGVTEVDEETLRTLYLPPYAEAVKAGAMSIMISFSSWNETKMHGEGYLINDVLKGELGFTGFIVSDWQGIDQLPGDYYSDVVASINAGMDMVMVPYDAALFITTLTDAVNAGDVSMERIDDAVTRILRVKFMLGLFERPFSNPEMIPLVGSEAHRAVAREAVSQSLVLLQNENNALPLSKAAPIVFVGGRGADNHGMQAGGWTMQWQGVQGELEGATSIREAVEAAVSPDSQVFFDRGGRFVQAKDENDALLNADLGIVVVGENPYAEGVGDQVDLTLAAEDIATINRMRERCTTLVVVILSGRPLVITEQLPLADAWVAAWWPGSEGAGVTDVLFGDKPFTGTLPYTWPRSNEQLPQVGVEDPLFAFGFGMTIE